MVRKLSSEEIHAKVAGRYSEISCSVKDRFKYPTGREALLKLGYDVSVIDSLPLNAVESFCGVGNPFSLGDIGRGDSVLDVGCGAGIDILVASKMAGSNGRIHGIDLVPEMVTKARADLKEAATANCEVSVSGSESMPFDDNSFDVVISNAAIYLSPLKKKTFSEILRVLRPGGRFMLADVVLNDDIPDNIMKLFDGWSG